MTVVQQEDSNAKGGVPVLALQIATESRTETGTDIAPCRKASMHPRPLFAA